MTCGQCIFFIGSACSKGLTRHNNRACSEFRTAALFEVMKALAVIESGARAMPLHGREWEDCLCYLPELDRLVLYYQETDPGSCLSVSISCQ